MINEDNHSSTISKRSSKHSKLDEIYEKIKREKDSIEKS